MENFNFDRNSRESDHLPQSEAEWLETRKFKIETIEIYGYQIRCAFTEGAEGERSVAMSGGIPRDPERRGKLPLINKLYGNLAVKLLNFGESSILYNQPATGGSSGDFYMDTIQSRSDVLAGVSRYLMDRMSAAEVSLVGTSAAGYMALKAAENLQSRDIKVGRIVLLSPGAYPEEVETMPYGQTFSDAIRKQWNIADSPAFSRLEKYVADGGSVLITFFEADDPPIPRHIQEHYMSIAQNLAGDGGDISVLTIPGVAHNFRRIGSEENRNIVDNDSIRSTADIITDFLTKND